MKKIKAHNKTETQDVQMRIPIDMQVKQIRQFALSCAVSLANSRIIELSQVFDIANEYSNWLTGIRNEKN